MTPEHLLATAPACVLPGAELLACLGADTADWNRFASHWDALVLDEYAFELSTTRYRRYGHFTFTPSDGALRQQPHDVFAQPEDSNPLYVHVDRHFEPLTDAFAADPVLRALLRLLGEIATALDDVADWTVKVTPFRVLASGNNAGDPAPEGPHRDGVTLVSSTLIGRDNAVGGESTIYDRDRAPLMKTTLSEPATMLVSDDRCTLHDVSPIQAIDPARPARRDVLVVTLAPLERSDRPPLR
jgi:hypothetical protein